MRNFASSDIGFLTAVGTSSLERIATLLAMIASAA
jgi:hypothetical protein